MNFDDWYHREYPRVLAAVSVVCRVEPRAIEDATTDAFITALERWGRVAEMDSPTAWVTRVAINNAKRRFRRSSREVAVANEDAITQIFSDSYRDADLVEALAKLTYRQRRALVLHYFEDQTQAAVAKALDVAPGTASATLAQARKNLRRELATTEEMNR